MINSSRILGTDAAPLPDQKTIREWHDALDAIKKHAVAINTPQGFGTGFLIAKSERDNVFGIATAFHVINHAHEWEEPIKIVYQPSGQNVVLRPSNRLIHVDPKRDFALILLKGDMLNLPSPPSVLIDKEHHKREGVELGWCGYPAIYPSQLCFFSGRVSAWIGPEDAYLVDGVVINGASGGPVFDKFASLVGFVSAYLPNQTLPGLGIIRSIEPYLEDFDRLKDKPISEKTDTEKQE